MTFFIRQASNGQYYFVIKSDNHEIVATSEMYHYKSTAQNTIDAMKHGINLSSKVIDMTV
ncbi:YegP family protein [Macrococcoides goetzii]|uniref:YegP family protein n=1 Tax=Macrococcus sp. PK TaxID=2801919 RepID=UPI001F0FDF39|nr:YegP family protein [Macrococcus sp. PK]